jgi:polyisoprenoid-binding protein YceI
MAVDTSTQAGNLTTWKIDPAHSTLEFAIKHMMFATVKGQFSEVDGTIVDDETNRSNSRVSATIHVGSITTRNEQRDAHLKSPDFFHHEQFPTITFESTSVEHKGDDRLLIRGNLTIRDITRPIELDTEITGRGKNPWGVEVAGWSARTTINRKDFGLNWNAALESGGFLVGDEVKVTLDIEAAKQ